MVQSPNPPLQSPPTVSGLPFLGNAPAFIAANGIPVEFLQKAQQDCGDIAHFKVMSQSFYLVSSPELVREILVERVKDFHKPEAVSEKPRLLGRFLGHGILTADYEEWRPQRKLIQPLMHTKYIEQYADTMAQMGNRLLSEWQHGEERNIHADMTRVTMWIIAETMFGISPEQTTSLDEAVSAGQKIVIDDLVSPIPSWLTGRNAQADKLNTQLTELVKRFISDHRADPYAEHKDLLSLLLATRDENGQPPSEEFLRDNILTMFFAGHETTANTLTWALYYLSQHPSTLSQLQQEVDSVLSPDRLPTLADLPNLPYTLMVIKETMRIQPTVGAFPRIILEDVTLGDYQLKANSTVLISPYVLHHDPRRWVLPEVYDPNRFSAECETIIAKYGYLPFGGGPRVCIGNHFALMEAQILLSLIVRHYQMHLMPDAKIEPLHHVTAYPKHGLPMRLEKRS
ncbi:MAG: cytochrome P450 [Anaerolineae bacterium]